MKPVFDKNGLATEPGDIRCFYYDPDTGEYTGWSDEYINTGVSMPGHSTDIDPGDGVAGQVAVFKNGAWSQEEDNRGEIVYSTTDGMPSTIDYIGPVHVGYTTTAPSGPYDKWDGEKWVTDANAEHAADVAAADEEKINKIDQANEYMNSKQWPGKAAMGRLKDTEKERYNEWLDYLDALEAVDTTSAPDIEWPTQP
ncbi:tail fiber assembly protein [Enterobacter cloacae complex sp. ECC445]|uniref:tail fiber assembly protein n=1 Tax=Enterobacter cloacae complex sp. ECC445 TaxID=2913213 RepID=UPI001F32D309|nr:tail fiber assembly protein [Enterobacter cloacae complex sp. ECC445]MCG0458565.1 tail fiber assembly protein [Enterobacter cloacae complex sp. ECC445]